jgi:hypothetical protein
LSILGELIAETNVLPHGWDWSNMSDIELKFVHHWIKRKRNDDWQTWGEMLGIYWTSDKFAPKSGNENASSSEKKRKVLLPLAGIIAPDTLHKTLERVLDKSPEPSKKGESSALAKTVDGHYSLDSLPLDKYKELFNFALDETSKSQTPAEQTQATASQLPAISTDGLVLTDMFSSPKFDLDKIRQSDPELAKHLDPECQW